MVNYILTSTFIHAALLLMLCISPALNTSVGQEKIEVNIVATKKEHKFVEQPPILPTLAKPLIPGQGAGKVGKAQKVDLTSYANRLKAVVDPIWYGHVHGLENRLPRKLTTIVLLFPDKHGNVVSIRIVKPSGSADLDALAIQSFREAGQIPIPPESLVKEGIEWEFSIGGGS